MSTSFLCLFNPPFKSARQEQLRVSSAALTPQQPWPAAFGSLLLAQLLSSTYPDPQGRTRNTNRVATSDAGSDMKWEHLEVLEKITIAPIRVNSSVATVTSSLVPASPAHPSAAAPALPSRLQSHLPSHLEVESASVGQLTAKSVLPMDAAGPLPFPGTQASKAGSFRLLLRRRPQLHPPAGSAGAPTPSTQAVAPAPEEGGEDGDDFPWVPVPGTLKKQSVSTFPSEQAYLQTSVSWVSLTQRSVVIPPGGSIVVGVNINSTGLRTGPSSAILVLRSNDPERPVMRAPLQQVAA